MTKQTRKSSAFQGTKRLFLSSIRNSGFSEKNLKKQQSLSWKQVNEKTYASLLSILEEAELKLLSENHDFIDDNETEAIQTLKQIKKQCMKKIKSAYYPEAKWHNIDMQDCMEWLEKMKEKNKLLLKAQEEEERELEELDDEMQSLQESTDRDEVSS